VPPILGPSLVVAVTALVLAAPAAHAAAPTGSDVSATVQNRADPDDTGSRPVVKIVASCSDPDGTPLSYAMSGDPPHGGYVTSDPAGFNYSPHVGFSGTDSFRYVALGGGDVSNQATVTINVLAPPAEDPDDDPGVLDRDGDGFFEDGEDKCPAIAAPDKRGDGCPPVVGFGVFTREARRVAKRLGKRWDRASVRRQAWATRQISVTLRVPSSAARGRGLRCAIDVEPVRRKRDGPLGDLMFGAGVPCRPGKRVSITLRLRTQYFPPARHRSTRLRLLITPRDHRGRVEVTSKLDLRPRR
jgi:Bacterial Ig domain